MHRLLVLAEIEEGNEVYFVKFVAFLGGGVVKLPPREVNCIKKIQGGERSNPLGLPLQHV